MLAGSCQPLLTPFTLPQERYRVTGGADYFTDEVGGWPNYQSCDDSADALPESILHNFPSGLNKKGARGKAEMRISRFSALRGVSIGRRSAAEDCADAQARRRCAKRKTASTRLVHRQARVGSCIRKKTAQNAHRGRAQPVQQQQTAAHKVGK